MLGYGVSEVLLGLLGFLLHQHDSTGESSNISFNLLEVLLLLFEGLGGLEKLVVRLVESNLQLLHFFAIVTDVAISLIGHALVLLGRVLELADGGIQTIGLGLEALHLFSDCVHGYMLNWLSKLILMTYYLQASLTTS